MKFLLSATFLCLQIWAAAQQAISLEQCLAAAQQHQPIARQAEMIAAAHREAIEILEKNNWPQASLNGQATWQNEVTSLPIKFPGIDVPTISKDQYRLTLELAKPLWDGGQNARQKDLQTLQTAAEQQRLRTDLYATREQTIQLFCAAVLAEKQSEILGASRADLVSRKNRFEEQVKNGTAIPAAVQNVEVRLLEIEQQNDEIESKKRAAMDGLALLTGLKIGPDDRLELAAPAGFQLPTGIERPELALFDVQMQNISAQQKLAGTKTRPRINAIGTLGYGRPGLNFLSNDFEPFAIVGLNFRWNLTNFYTRSVGHEREQLQIQIQKTGAQREQFLLQTSVRQQQQVREIERLEAVAAKDQKMLDLRKELVATAAVQLENGVLTATEFLSETALETASKLNASLHEIQLVQAKLLLNFISGR